MKIFAFIALLLSFTLITLLGFMMTTVNTTDNDTLGAICIAIATYLFIYAFISTARFFRDREQKEKAF